MRTAAALLTLLVIGCSSEAQSPKAAAPSTTTQSLGIASGKVREDRWPLQFDLDLTNTGDKPIAINGVELQILGVMASRPRNASGPLVEQFDYDVTLLRNQPKGDESREGLQSGEVVEIPPGKRTISCLLKWRLPPDSPMMFAVISARLGPSFRRRELMWSAPIVFLLESEPGVLEALIASNPTDRERAALLLPRIEQLEGQRTPNVERLRRMLRELVDKPVK
jgi:hypothetical protein